MGSSIPCMCLIVLLRVMIVSFIKNRLLACVDRKFRADICGENGLRSDLRVFNLSWREHAESMTPSRRVLRTHRVGPYCAHEYYLLIWARLLPCSESAWPEGEVDSLPPLSLRMPSVAVLMICHELSLSQPPQSSATNLSLP